MECGVGDFIAEGVLALGLLIALQYLITWLSVRSHLVDRLVKSEPVLLLHRGEFLSGPMREARVSDDETLAAIRKMRIPATGPLLIAGLLFGPAVPGLVQPELLGVTLRVVVRAAVAVIVFEGGLLLDVSELRHTTRAVVGLVSVGLLITPALAGLLAPGTEPEHVVEVTVGRTGAAAGASPSRRCAAAWWPRSSATKGSSCRTALPG